MFSAPEGLEALAADGVALLRMFEADEFGERIIGAPDGVGVAAIGDAAHHDIPDAGGPEGCGEARPPDGDDGVGRAEAGPKAGEFAIALLHGPNRVDDAHKGAVDFGAAEIEQEAMANGRKAEDEDIARFDGVSDITYVNVVIVIHAS